MPKNEHIGTLNFMSVNNLEGNSNTRTELDDWEALIYVLVWLGTFGLNGMSRHNSDTDEHRRIAGAKIKYWVDGKTLEDISRFKRGDLDNSSSFKSIINDFDSRVDHINVLAGLLSMMRGTLIDNAGCSEDGRGANMKQSFNHGNCESSASKVTPGSFPPLSKFALAIKRRGAMNTPMVDPFKVRTDMAPTIAKELLAILGNIAEYCQELLNKAGTERNETNTTN
ncbi:hypothetical protein BX661DRAFT_187508 [Kickxella alabastrina]|uniref:uncharacterized protein n=1 Tax=Kickxella alabastrina TaxID=61397 RepID=UPI0022201D96|nr:uncharacterized protein BX661DRAFT_187508 [Kickxella alabastrina]KAI7822500.1 hypothetical protein BX661DRAFT_187508 [Kickxella alabastrina]